MRFEPQERFESQVIEGVGFETDDGCESGWGEGDLELVVGRVEDEDHVVGVFVHEVADDVLTQPPIVSCSNISLLSVFGC
ncbi:hypothetical protein IU497_33620 [Nocardia terpenica]|nr:hypothetical protein [Nocardia terpenica]